MADDHAVHSRTKTPRINWDEINRLKTKRRKHVGFTEDTTMGAMGDEMIRTQMNMPQTNLKPSKTMVSQSDFLPLHSTEVDTTVFTLCCHSVHDYI